MRENKLKRSVRFPEKDKGLTRENDCQSQKHSHRHHQGSAGDLAREATLGSEEKSCRSFGFVPLVAVVNSTAFFLTEQKKILALSSFGNMGNIYLEGGNKPTPYPPTHSAQSKNPPI